MKNVSQVPGESHRRWFVDPLLDLTVWFSSKRCPNIIGFQLLYAAENERKALTWRQGAGYHHHRVDEGETRPGRPKQTPVLSADGAFRKDDVVRMFSDACREMDRVVAEFVIDKLTGA